MLTHDGAVFARAVIKQKLILLKLNKIFGMAAIIFSPNAGINAALNPF